MKNQLIQEQIRKRVARSGNSGAVWVPKDWLGEEILVTRLQTPKLSLGEELINILLPYLKDISGIFLYGSYARKEETKGSDIDVLIIAKNTFTMKHTKKFDITVLETSKIEDVVQKNPFIYAMLREAKPLFNSSLLEELQQSKKNFKPFIRWFKETTLDSIVSTKELIDLDSEESTYLTSYSVVYSLLLRLRGIFLLHSVLTNKPFTNALFKKYLTRFISVSSFIKLLQIYRNVRDNKKIDSVQIEIVLANKLLDLLQREVGSFHD